MIFLLSINFDSGNYKEFAINGDENNTVKINISDMGILTRAQDALKHIDGIVEELTEKEKQGVDNAELFKEQDEKARQMVNTIFATDICTRALGGTNAFSVASNGKPVIVNLLEALIQILVQEIKATQTAAQIKLEDKTDKYIKPVTISPAKPFIPLAEPKIDIDALTAEEKNALLKELLK